MTTIIRKNTISIHKNNRNNDLIWYIDNFISYLSVDYTKGGDYINYKNNSDNDNSAQDMRLILKNIKKKLNVLKSNSKRYNVGKRYTEEITTWTDKKHGNTYGTTSIFDIDNNLVYFTEYYHGEYANINYNFRKYISKLTGCSVYDIDIKTYTNETLKSAAIAVSNNNKKLLCRIMKHNMHYVIYTPK